MAGCRQVYVLFEAKTDILDLRKKIALSFAT
jgi:hypothetical protein